PTLVGVLDGPRHDEDQPGTVAGAALEAGEVPGEAAALDEAHAEVGAGQSDAGVVFADVVERHDVGMVQASDGGGLVPEALDICERGPRSLGQHLQGDNPEGTRLAVPDELPSLVDNAHPPAGDFPQ